MLQVLKPYFTFTKTERRGFYVLIVLIIAAGLWKIYISTASKTFNPVSNPEIEQFERQIKAFVHTQKQQDFKNKTYYKKNNGYKKSINKNKAEATLKNKQTDKKNATFFKTKQQTTEKSITVNINTADTTEWKKLRGIGKVLSKRIVAFRDKLGGFYTVAQLKEVYGLKPEVYEQIKPQLTLPEGFVIKKIDINNAPVKQIASHPYINWDLANLIVAYRKQHDGFKTVYELQRTNLVNDKLYRKLAPYLTVKKYVVAEN